MDLTTLVDLLERDVGQTASTRANLADLLAERGDRQGAAKQNRIAARRAGRGGVQAGNPRG